MVGGISTWNSFVIEFTKETSPSSRRRRENKLVSPSVGTVLINGVNTLGSLDGQFLRFGLRQQVRDGGRVVTGRSNLHTHPNNRLETSLSKDINLNVLAWVGLSITSNQTEVTTDVSVNGCGITKDNGIRLAVGGNNSDHTIIRVDGPVEGRRLDFVQQCLVPSLDTSDDLDGTSNKGVLSVVDHHTVVATREKVPPVAVIMDLEEFITTGINNLYK